MPPETPDNLDAQAKTSGYWSADLAPVAAADRTWGLRDIAAFWVALSACIPTYMLASSLIEEGMNWWQAVLTIFLGNVIVLAPMILNAHAGTRYGIPFPVLCRASFGLRGANLLTCAIGLPHDEAAGLRFGTPEITRLGMTADHMPEGMVCIFFIFCV